MPTEAVVTVVPTVVVQLEPTGYPKLESVPSMARVDGYFGVWSSEDQRRFDAGINIRGVFKSLGSYRTLSAAAKAYDAEAVHLPGKPLNFPAARGASASPHGQRDSWEGVETNLSASGESGGSASDSALEGEEDQLHGSPASGSERSALKHHGWKRIMNYKDLKLGVAVCLADAPRPAPLIDCVVVKAASRNSWLRVKVVETGDVLKVRMMDLTWPLNTESK
jgi:hypothetical protein